MKIPSINRCGLFVSVTALNLALLPALSHAQTTNPTPDNPTGSPQDSKVSTSSTAQQHDATTGAPTDQPGTLDKTPTKDPSGPASIAETTGKDKTDSSLSMSDKKFIEDAAQGGMTEVQLGQIAEQKGNSPDVKEFGAHMVADHSKANDDLKSLAQAKGVAVPSELDHKHQAMVNHLQSLSGPAFDHAYIHSMVRAHEADAAAFKKTADTTQDPDLKAFASKTLEVVQSHLTMVQDIQSKMAK